MSTNEAHAVDSATRHRMEQLGIDVERSQEILAALNRGAYDDVEPLEAGGIPEMDGSTIIDRRGSSSLTLPDDAYRSRMAELAPELPAEKFGTVENGVRRLDNADLETIGVLLYPYVSYGVLNGGSATSYADVHKNRSYDEDLFELYRAPFERLTEQVQGRPKGITPAYLNPDGTTGASFLELKFRMVLRAGERYRRTAEHMGVEPPAGADGSSLEPGLPFVEMTSLFTDEAVHAAYDQYRDSVYLREFPHRTRALQTASAVQPLLAAMTHSTEGRPRRFFLNAWGLPGEPLGLPGGHGQNFQVLAPVYRSLKNRGKRFVYMGNVDNVGFTIEPVSVAIMALRGAQAGFDFAFRTPVDVKGGILVYDQNGALTCGDIGPAISKEQVFAAEEAGKKILFNCATGLFNLDYLVPNLNRVVAELPMRISDQNKDAGKYSQAEQVTWEIIGMLDDVIIFGIDKYRRFLAAKMLLESFLTSGLSLDEAQRIQPTAPQLSRGLATVLREEYDMELRDGRWQPATQ
ncbi:MAG: UTP--glucose-1-phosphate uridylyltransferase [Alkalispirochaeta sp.]